MASSALVAEAARRSRVCWLTYASPERTPVCRLAWHLWRDDALWVVAGDGAQRLEGLADAAAVEVTLRGKDTGTRVVTWVGRPRPVPPDTDAWGEAATALLAQRLNLRDPAATRRAWHEQATIIRIVAAEDR